MAICVIYTCFAKGNFLAMFLKSVLATQNVQDNLKDQISGFATDHIHAVKVCDRMKTAQCSISV